MLTLGNIKIFGKYIQNQVQVSKYDKLRRIDKVILTFLVINDKCNNLQYLHIDTIDAYEQFDHTRIKVDSGQLLTFLAIFER